MSRLRPDITGDVWLYGEGEGARKSATPSGQFGCIFVYEGEAFDCRLLLDDSGPIEPGERAKVPIKFLRPELIKQRLGVGSRFCLREVGTIGEGIVEGIVSDTG